MKELIERLRERENWFQEALFEEPVEGIVSALTIDEIYCQEIMSELRQAADALERQQWRPVSEGLPEPLKVVLCLNESCGVIDRYVDDDHEWFNVPYWWKEKGGVTHWMPLPEPPQD